MAKLPGLFAKLLGNYGDDIARGVTNYGDDVVGAVANYGDDAARAVANYGDDVAGLVADNAGRAAMSPELLSDDFLDAVDDFAYHTPKYGDDITNTATMRKLSTTDPTDIMELMDRGVYGTYFPDDVDMFTSDPVFTTDNAFKPVEGFDFDNKYIPHSYEMPNAPSIYNNDGTLKYLGYATDHIPYTGDFSDVRPLEFSVEVPGLDNKGIVREYLGAYDVPNVGYELGFYRPHKNTALGRWFTEEMKKKV